MIHSRVRLAIIASLASKHEVDYIFLRGKLNLTDGNLASHLRKLEDAGYIKVRKEFLKRRPRTSYSITSRGKIAFSNYVREIEKIIKA